MATIIVSSRAGDEEAVADLIAAELVRRLGSGQVLRSPDSAVPNDYLWQVTSQVQRCDALLVVIGARWLGSADGDGTPKIGLPTDRVRAEIATALESDKPVTAVLVGDARMPAAADLPTGIRELARCRQLRLPGPDTRTGLPDLADAIAAELPAADADLVGTANVRNVYGLVAGADVEGEVTGKIRGHATAEHVLPGGEVTGLKVRSGQPTRARSAPGPFSASEPASGILPSPATQPVSAAARPVVVLTALNLEGRAVRQHLTGLWTPQHPAGTVFYQGFLANSTIPVVLAITGQGNLAAAIFATNANSVYQPRALLFVGVAGGLRDKAKIGDVVVATHVYAYQGGTATADGLLGRPRAWEAPHELLQLARRLELTREWIGLLPADQRTSPPAVHFGPVAAGEVVLRSHDSPTAHHIKHHYSDAVAIDMEDVGAAQAGHLASLPVLIIRGISDNADEHKELADASGSQSIAAANAAAFAAALIRSM